VGVKLRLAGRQSAGQQQRADHVDVAGVVLALGGHLHQGVRVAADLDAVAEGGAEHRVNRQLARIGEVLGVQTNVGDTAAGFENGDAGVEAAQVHAEALDDEHAVRLTEVELDGDARALKAPLLEDDEGTADQQVPVGPVLELEADGHVVQLDGAGVNDRDK